MGAKHQGSKRQHPLKAPSPMPGAAAAKSSVMKAKTRPNPPMTHRKGRGAS